MEIGDHRTAQRGDRAAVDLEIDRDIAPLQRPRREEHEQTHLAGRPPRDAEHLVGRSGEGLDRAIVEHAAIELALRAAQREAFPARRFNAVLCKSPGAAAQTARHPERERWWSGFDIRYPPCRGS